jgi:hypothetical protein
MQLIVFHYMFRNLILFLDKILDYNDDLLISQQDE